MLGTGTMMRIGCARAVERLRDMRAATPETLSHLYYLHTLLTVHNTVDENKQMHVFIGASNPN